MAEIRNRIIGEAPEDPEQLLANPFNFRRHPKQQLDALEGVLEEIGWVQRVVANKRTGHLIDGHARVELAIRRGEKSVPVLYVDLTEAEERVALATMDPIGSLAYQDDEALKALLESIAVENAALQDFLATLETDQQAGGAAANQDALRTTLTEQFLIPPFTLFDARQGYWQDRKRAWKELGLASEDGRGENLLFGDQKGDVGARILAAGGGTSIFDPVLCEVAYRWYAPPGGRILDPFAGGSVRGVVAAVLGYDYTGIDLRPEQVEANQANWARIAQAPQAQPEPEETTSEPADNTPAQTPVEKRGEYWFKRDDLWQIAGSRGGKARTCWHLAQGATGLITAGSRQSPQVNLVAQIAARLGIPCRVHVPSGDLTPELIDAQAANAEVKQHKPGHNSVIVARAREDAKESGWREIPFGMECDEAIRQTAAQVANLPWGEFNRIVIPVGSGMNLAGLLHGLEAEKLLGAVKVVGVQVGADPTKRLNKWAPQGWESCVTLVKSAQDYHDAAPVTTLEGVKLDPIYEAKCLPFLEPGDLLWCVGIRKSETASAPKKRRIIQTDGAPEWITGDSTTLDTLLEGREPFDMIMSCPPYADLEVYSDDAADISNMEYPAFVEAYREIIRKAADKLADNRFAVWVVGEVRDNKGNYRNFVGDTIAAFEDAGLRYYNEAVLITSVGSLPLRAGNMFRASRKLGKGHQNVLIFKKGDPTPEPLTGFGEWLGKYFEQNKELLELHEKVLVFVKGDANKAAKEFGPVMTADPEMSDGN